MKPIMRRGGQQRSIAVTVPAPMKGVNSTRVLSSMDPQECIFAVNILPEDFGCEVRDGFVEWANGWTGTPARTVITFEGNVGADDKLWVANSEGIWDVTLKGETAPTQDVAFPSSADNAGICSYINYGNDAGDRFLLLCDGENGYYVWTQTTGLWERIAMGGGGITGADPNLFNFIMIWKQRVWFVQRETGHAFFLSKAEEFLGAAVLFNFGDQFRFGGPLISLHNWTLDGGDGMDDYLVAISSAGDVIIYRGTDPTSSSDFFLVGSWYVGQLPAGNRVASEFSGELYILSVQGLLPMSEVLNSSSKVYNPELFVTKKIAPYIRSVMDEVQNSFGWHVHIHPKQSLLYVNSPPRVGNVQVAFTLYFGTLAWGTIRDLPKSHTANWQGEVYWTDIGRNKIFIQQGFVDGVYLDPGVDGDPEAIEWDLLTQYTDLDAPATYKRVQYIRPMFVGTGVPTFQVVAAYDFNIFEQTTSPSFTGSGQSLWAAGGVYVHTLASDGADLLVMSFTDGTAQIGGVTTIDVTLGTHPLAILTWNVPNQRYEGASIGIRDYLISEIGNALATTIDPDTLTSSLYTVGPVALNADAGFTVPAILDGTPPASMPNGTFSPTILFGTNSPNSDDGLWNIAVWSGGLQTSDNPRGASGMGRHVAINLRGRSSTEVTLVGFDVIYDVGGIL